METLKMILILVVSFLASLISTRFAINLGKRLGILDRPNPRKVHSRPIPRTGGTAILIGFMLGALVSYLLLRAQESPQELPLKGFLWLILSSFLLGFLDDKFDLNPWLKLLGQTLIASVSWILGLKVQFLTNFLPWFKGEFIFLSPLLSFLFTTFWIIGLMNAMNLIDGLDGLLSGVTLIISLIMGFIAILMGRDLLGGFALALCGASAGFLVYNFHPARIFLGDGGSLFIGASLAGLSIMGPLKTITLISLIPAILIFAFPITDTFLAIIRRLLKRKPVFSPDKEHIHHQLLKVGLTPVQAVIVLYAFTFLSSFLGFLLSLRIFR